LFEVIGKQSASSKRICRCMESAEIQRRIVELHSAINKMRDDLMQLENTLSSDPNLFDKNNDDIENLSENLLIIKRKHLWRF
jgi:chromosome segregation ATPase